MAVSSDFTISQNGGQGNAKLHPYLVALVRWCVSCLWSSATLLLHRLITAPLPALTAPKTWKSRPASKEHLHPEPKVQCTVLHQPAVHTLDVIFVHGLYGSLANTWRQGEWRPKYSREPEKVHLRRPTLIPAQRNCSCCDYTTDTQTSIEGNDTAENKKDSIDEDKNDIFNYDEDFTNLDEKFYNKIKHILPIDETFTTEKFYNNTLLNHVEIVDNYESQARFVSDLFKNCDNSINGSNRNNKIDSHINNYRKFVDKDDNLLNISQNKSGFKQNKLNYDIHNENNSQNANMIKDIGNNYDNTLNDNNINYSSDNDNKENIDNTETKDEADYDNCVNTIKDEKDKCKCREDNKIEGVTNEINCKCKNDVKQCDVGCGCLCDECYSSCWPRDWVKEDYPGARVISIDYTSDPHLWRPLWIKGNKRLRLHERAEQMTLQLLDMGVGQKPVIWVGHSKGGLFIKQIYCEAYEAYLKTKDGLTQREPKKPESPITHNSYETNCDIFSDINTRSSEESCTKNNVEIFDTRVYGETGDFDGEYHGASTKDSDFKLGDDVTQQESSNYEGDHSDLSSRASLWSNSVGFMFYSVPHRGSPLADIKTPVTARSVELLEISKDCALVLSLQERWLRAAAAAAAARPALVRSLVETRRTLMSVLWLRIVSYDSADPGLGALCGVSVDHREICKPSSRRCLLYTELKALIGAALARRGPHRSSSSQERSLSEQELPKDALNELL